MTDKENEECIKAMLEAGYAREDIVLLIALANMKPKQEER